MEVLQVYIYGKFHSLQHIQYIQILCNNIVMEYISNDNIRRNGTAT